MQHKMDGKYLLPCPQVKVLDGQWTLAIMLYLK
jgi:hypothetical protein